MLMGLPADLVTMVPLMEGGEEISVKYKWWGLRWRRLVDARDKVSVVDLGHEFGWATSRGFPESEKRKRIQTPDVGVQARWAPN